MSVEVMSVTEYDRLKFLESRIEERFKGTIELATYLTEIRDSKLYRSQYLTWEEYCKGRWNLSKTHANRAIAFSGVTKNLTPTGVNPPRRESQARPLTVLRPDDQAEAWQEAQEEAGTDQPPARVVQSVVNRRLGKPPVANLNRQPQAVQDAIAAQADVLGVDLTGGHCIINGVVSPDPPDIAERRAAGKIAATSIITIEEPPPEAEGVTVELLVEEDSEREAVKADAVTDDEYARSFDLHGLLTGKPLETYVSTAKSYRRLEPGVRRLRAEVTAAEKAVRRLNPYTAYLRRHLPLVSPEKWTICQRTEEGGCGGSGIAPLGDICPACRGYGFIIPGVR